MLALHERWLSLVGPQAWLVPLFAVYAWLEKCSWKPHAVQLKRSVLTTHKSDPTEPQVATIRRSPLNLGSLPCLPLHALVYVSGKRCGFPASFPLSLCPLNPTQLPILCRTCTKAAAPPLFLALADICVCCKPACCMLYCAPSPVCSAHAMYFARPGPSCSPSLAMSSRALCVAAFSILPAGSTVDLSNLPAFCKYITVFPVCSYCSAACLLLAPAASQNTVSDLSSLTCARHRCFLHSEGELSSTLNKWRSGVSILGRGSEQQQDGQCAIGHAALRTHGAWGDAAGLCKLHHSSHRPRRGAWGGVASGCSREVAHGGFSHLATADSCSRVAGLLGGWAVDYASTCLGEAAVHHHHTRLAPARERGGAPGQALGTPPFRQQWPAANGRSTAHRQRQAQLVVNSAAPVCSESPASSGAQVRGFGPVHDASALQEEGVAWPSFTSNGGPAARGAAQRTAPAATSSLAHSRAVHTEPPPSSGTRSVRCTRLANRSATKALIAGERRRTPNLIQAVGTGQGHASCVRARQPAAPA